MSERSDIEDVWGEIVGDAFTPSHPLPPPPEFAGAVDEEMQARPSARLPLHVVPMSGPDSDAMPIEVADPPGGRPHPAGPVARAKKHKTAPRRPQSESDALAAPQAEVADPLVEVDLRQRRRRLPPTMRTAPVTVQDDLDVVLFEVAQTGPHAIVPPEEIVELDVTDLDIDEYPSLLEADGRAVIEVDLDDIADDDDAVVAGEIDIVEPRAVPRGPGEATRALARSAAIANVMRGATVRVPLVPERKVKTAMPSVSRMHPGKATTVRTAAVAVSPARPQTMRAAALATARPQTMRVAAIAVSPTQPAIVSSPEVAESPKPTEVVPSPAVVPNDAVVESPTSIEVAERPTSQTTPGLVLAEPHEQPRAAKPSTVRVVAVSGVKPATVRATAVPVDAREAAFAPAPVPVMPALVALTPPPSDPPLVDRAPSSSVSLRRVSVGDHVVAPRRNGWAWIAGAAAVVLGAIAIAAFSGSDAEPAAAGASAHGVAAAAVEPAKPSLAQTPVATPETSTPVPSEPAAAPSEASPSEASPSEAAVVNVAPVEPGDASQRAAGLAYVAAVERFEADHSNEAVEAMVSAACEMDDGPRARSAFRKLRGADQRTRVMIACRNRGIDLWARVDGPTASELLVVAERHLAEGDYVHALESARESNHVTRNNGALFVMGVAQCKLGRPAEAEELERHLPPRIRRDLELACAKG